MPLIWVHTSYPKVKQLAFPMILEGFHAGQISEKTIRFYYIRNMHWRKFFNEENRTKDLDTLFAQLSLNVGKNVCVKDILRAYNESEEFLNQNFKIIGHWNDPKNDATVKIMKSEDGAYYYHNLYADGSAYPQKIVQDNTYPNLYRNYFKPEFYFGVQPNGDLSIKNTSGKRTLKPIKKIDRH